MLISLTYMARSVLLRRVKRVDSARCAPHTLGGDPEGGRHVGFEGESVRLSVHCRIPGDERVRTRVSPHCMPPDHLPRFVSPPVETFLLPLWLLYGIYWIPLAPAICSPRCSFAFGYCYGASFHSILSPRVTNNCCLISNKTCFPCI
jgi:hypothetical protein